MKAARASAADLARVPGKEAEALELLLEIKEEQGLSKPTLLGLYYTLSYHQDPEQPVMELIDSVFLSRQAAYQILGNQWLRTRDHFPVHGVAKALTLLEKELEIPEGKSVLDQELQQPMDPDDYFSK